MSDVKLRSSTHVPLTDRILQAVIRTYESTFPKRVRGYYLIGSYVEHTAVPLSDIDCIVIFADDWKVLEATAAEQLGQQCASSSRVRLDITAYPQNKLDQLHPVIRVVVKQGSSLVYGTDIRPTIILPPMSTYAPAVITDAQQFIARLRGMMHLTPTRVDYPDATDLFFGYTRKSIPAWYPPTADAGTKELVATVSRIASAMVVRGAQTYIPGKQAAVALFQKHIGGAWAPFVQQVYQQCKLEWQYGIPVSERDRYQLRTFCEKMLVFENMFLQTYCETV